MKLKQKLKQSRGETIAETLIAMLVIAVCTVMLACAIGSAFKVNRASDALNRDFTTEGAAAVSGFVVTVTHSDGSSSKAGSSDGVTGYQTQDGYYYYYETKIS